MTKALSFIRSKIHYIALLSLIALCNISPMAFASQAKYENTKFSVMLPDNTEVKSIQVPIDENNKRSATAYLIKVADDVMLSIEIMSQPNLQKNSITINDQRNAITGMVDGMKKSFGKNPSKSETDGVYQSIQSTNIDGKDYQIFKLPHTKGKFIFYSSVSNKKLCLMMFAIPSSKLNTSDSLIKPILDSLIIK